MSEETLDAATPDAPAEVDTASDAPQADSTVSEDATTQEVVQPDSDEPDAAPEAQPAPEAEAPEAPAPSQVLAKFSIQSLTQMRNWDPANPTCLQVKLGASQGEPFGSATPSGQIDMLIVNPAAQQVFFDAWQDLVAGKRTKSPEFFVTFALAEA